MNLFWIIRSLTAEAREAAEPAVMHRPSPKLSPLEQCVPAPLRLGRDEWNMQAFCPS